MTEAKCSRSSGATPRTTEIYTLSLHDALPIFAPEDREHFAAVTHEHFQQIFSKADVTAEDVHSNTLAILKGDARLAKYATAA